MAGKMEVVCVSDTHTHTHIKFIQIVWKRGEIDRLTIRYETKGEQSLCVNVRACAQCRACMRLCVHAC